jgi:hypothetical protein
MAPGSGMQDPSRDGDIAPKTEPPKNVCSPRIQERRAGTERHATQRRANHRNSEARRGRVDDGRSYADSTGSQSKPTTRPDRRLPCFSFRFSSSNCFRLLRIATVHPAVLRLPAVLHCGALALPPRDLRQSKVYKLMVQTPKSSLKIPAARP